MWLNTMNLNTYVMDICIICNLCSVLLKKITEGCRYTNLIRLLRLCNSRPILHDCVVCIRGAEEPNSEEASCVRLGVLILHVTPHIQMCVSYVVLESYIRIHLQYLPMLLCTRTQYKRYIHTYIHHPRMYIPRVLSMGRVIEYVRTAELGDYQVMSGGALLLLELV